MKELAIGEIGLVDGVLVKCVEWSAQEEGCIGCAFYSNTGVCESDWACSEGRRKDKKNVKFIQSDSCRWTEDPDGIWYTSCEHAHEFTTGTPEENDHLYCPYCGHVLDAIHWKDA